MTTLPDLTTDADRAHLLFASLDGMEDVPSLGRRRSASFTFPGLATLQIAYPGLLAALTIALAATWLSQHYQAPVMLLALLFGMTFHFLHEEGRCVPGIEFASKVVLRVGVALLGARITVAQILGLGGAPIAIVVAAVTTTIIFGILAARSLSLSRVFGVLSGGAVAICGASAALAIASVLPRDRNAERDTVFAVVTVTTLSTIAMILYPLVVAALHLNHTSAGIFLGGSIHDVAQVVGAGYTVSPETGDIAVYVKLLRVTTLLPTVFAIALAVRRKSLGQAVGKGPPIPLFLIFFAALVVVGSFGWLPHTATEAADGVSRWCLVTAIAALGMKTSFKSLISVGWRPILLMVAETLWIGALVLTGVVLFT